MKILKLALVLGALVMTTAMGCDQSGCSKDAGGNTDCPVRQHNPSGGLVNDPA
jgi:hypothetical protein